MNRTAKELVYQMITNTPMPKDYQEIERIVENFAAKFTYREGSELHNIAVYPYPLPTVQAWLKDTLTTYGNATVDEIIKIAEGMKKEEISMDSGDPNSHYYAGKNDGHNQALTDFIKAIKK